MFNILYYLLTFSPEVVSEWKKDSSSAVWQKHVRDFVIKIQIIDQDGSLISFCRIINKQRNPACYFIQSLFLNYVLMLTRCSTSRT